MAIAPACGDICKVERCRARSDNSLTAHDHGADLPDIRLTTGKSAVGKSGRQQCRFDIGCRRDLQLPSVQPRSAAALSRKTLVTQGIIGDAKLQLALME